MITFAAHPWLVVSLLVAPLALVLLWWGERLRARRLRRFASDALLPTLTASFSRRRQLAKLSLLVLALVLLGLSLARPQVGYTWEEHEARGVDFLIALDTSRSMLAEDVAPNRLTRAKLAVLDLVDQLEGDRIGLIAFAGSAFLQCPLTLDYDAFRQSLEATDTTTIPRGGTDIAAAIDEALAYFDRNRNFRQLILITDGEDLEASGIARAEAAAAAGVVIHTIGVGSTDGEFVPVTLPNGQRDFMRDAAGRVVRSQLDEATLQALARVSGGHYAQLGGDGSGLRTLLGIVRATVPAEELGNRLQRVAIERFQWPLGIAILLLLLEPFIPARRRLTAPANSLLPILALVLASQTAIIGEARADETTAGQTATKVSLYDAQRAYRAGDHAAAARLYSQLANKRPTDGRIHYNHGVALFRDGQFAEAAAAFKRALQYAKPRDQADVFFNLGNSLVRQGAAALESDPQVTAALWREALQHFDHALELDPAAADASGNRQQLLAELAARTHRLAVTAAPAEGGTATGDGHYFNNTTAKLNAKPADGYTFLRWEGAPVEDAAQSSIEFVVTNSLELTALFAKTWHLDVTSLEPERGSAERSGDYPEGQPVSIRAQANDYFAFSRWWADGVELQDPFSAETTLTLSGDARVAATFVDAYKLAVEGDPQLGVLAGPSGFFARNSEVPVEARPRPGFEWSTWIGLVADTAAPQTTVQLDGDRVVIAKVNRVWNLVVLPSDDAAGTTEGGGNHPVGATVPISAQANDGFRFEGWHGPGVADPTAASTTVTVQDGDHDVIAVFVQDEGEGESQDSSEADDNQNQQAGDDNQSSQDDSAADQQAGEDGQSSDQQDADPPQQPEAADESEAQQPDDQDPTDADPPAAADDEAAAAADEQEARQAGQMTRDEARQLLNMLRNNERQLPASRSIPHDGDDTRGRDW
jgi:Ca-activated chloride channel homolog